MAKMKQIILDIQERLMNSGARPDFDKIAKEIGCPVKWVIDEFESMQQMDFGFDYDGGEY